MSLFRTLASAVMSGKGGQGNLAAMIMQNPKLMQAAMDLLAKDSPIGGLQGLVKNFQNAGMGDVVASWLGNGENKPVSGNDIQKALGGGVMDQLAAQANMTPTDASNVLSQALPVMIDKLTPKGNADSPDKATVQSMLVLGCEPNAFGGFQIAVQRLNSGLVRSVGAQA